MRRAAASVGDIAAADWNRLANPPGVPFNPLVSHDFFLALEQSGSAAAKAGWMPRHVVEADASGRITGIAPAYLKSHSQGEYVFDHGWAEAQCAADRASSVHVTFMPEAEWAAIGGGPWLQRTDIQFHWHNAGYATFDDFLKSLSSQKRKNIRKEREMVAKRANGAGPI